MTSPQVPQDDPGDQSTNPEADGTVGVSELFQNLSPFGPPPSADEAFPPAMRPVPPPPPPPLPTAGRDLYPAPEPPRRRRSVVFLASTAAVALAGTGGVAAYASAHKTVTLDVDGKVSRVETFQGDVADLLVDEGIEVTGRDVVTPGTEGALHDGGRVVVRYSHHVTVRADGERRTAWVAAVDADQALATLSEGSRDVVLLPTRADGRVSLPMRLDADGPVNLVVGGQKRQVPDGAATLDELLAERAVTVDGDDRIRVEREASARPGAPTLSIVIEQVQTSIDQTVTSLPFRTLTAPDPDRFEDLAPYRATKGAAGERITSWDVTTVDGKVVDKEKLSTWVARAPVDEVILYGTKARPDPKPTPKPEPSSEPKPKPAKPKPGPKPEKPAPKSEPD
ncbi:ubiquitin-like domain-containing protein [Promicromonospora sp. Populi]|uniref:ubiquitin-like domain-containing protein n=1 Tax=Promicromonospora sp. Populi TaxID=3239420 RepID=UPI0034E1CE78